MGYLNLLYPILAGLFAFLATITGSFFFKEEKGLVMIVMGAGFYMLFNHLLYKLKFNSYK